MTKKDIVIIADYSREVPISLDELCEICNIKAGLLRDLIEYEVIHPQGETPDEWAFSMMELQRLQTALRLQRDLEINLPGIAVVLELLDQLEELRRRMELLERHR